MRNGVVPTLAALATSVGPATAETATGDVDVARLCLRVADYISLVSDVVQFGPENSTERGRDFVRFSEEYSFDKRLFQIVGGQAALEVLNKSSFDLPQFEDGIKNCLESNCEDGFLAAARQFWVDFHSACEADFRGQN